MTELANVIPWMALLVVFVGMGLCVLLTGPLAGKREAFRQHGGGEGIFNRPSTKVYSAKNRLVVDPCDPGRFFQRHFPAPKPDDPVFPCVSSLNNFGRPNAIIRRVRAVVVFAVNRVLWRWAQPHVVEETLEPGKRAISKAPTITYGNPATAISWVIWPLRLMTSAPNINPNSIFGCPVHSMYARNHDGNHPWFLNICQLDLAP